MVSGRVEGDFQKSVQNYKTGGVYGSSSTPPPLFERARWTRDTARAVIETHERLGCGCGPPSKSKLDARKRDAMGPARRCGTVLRCLLNGAPHAAEERSEPISRRL